MTHKHIKAHTCTRTVQLGSCAATPVFHNIYCVFISHVLFVSVEKEKERGKKAGENRERAGRKHKVLASGKSDDDGGQIDIGTE